jgi:hypothetical protein
MSIVDSAEKHGIIVRVVSGAKARREARKVAV